MCELVQVIVHLSDSEKERFLTDLTTSTPLIEFSPSEPDLQVSVSTWLDDNPQSADWLIVSDYRHINLEKFSWKMVEIIATNQNTCLAHLNEIHYIQIVHNNTFIRATGWLHMHRWTTSEMMTLGQGSWI